MTVFDIVCGLLLAVGAWKGWRDGIIVQLSGILGLLVGVYLAYRYSIPGKPLARFGRNDRTGGGVPARFRFGACGPCVAGTP